MIISFTKTSAICN